MTDQVLPVDASVNNMIRMFQTQLTNISSMVDTQVSLISESLDSDADEHNKLVALVEKFESENLTLGLKIAEMEKAAEEAVNTHKTELAQVTSKLNRANVAVSDFAEIKEEFKRLKELNPDRLNKRIHELRKTSEERLKQVQSLRKDQGLQLAKIADLKKNLAISTNTLTECSAENEELRKRLIFADGDVVKAEFKGKNGLRAFIHSYAYGQRCASTDNVKFISDLDWHMEIKTNYGISLCVSITDWVVPFHPVCTELKNDWPENISDALQKIVIERLESSHSHIIDRMQWAQNIGVDEVPGLTDREIKLLTESNVISLYSAMHVPADKLCNMVKGMGEAACNKVQATCRKIVAEWEAENWTREQRGLK